MNQNEDTPELRQLYNHLHQLQDGRLKAIQSSTGSDFNYDSVIAGFDGQIVKVMVDIRKYKTSNQLGIFLRRVVMCDEDGDSCICDVSDEPDAYYDGGWFEGGCNRESAHGKILETCSVGQVILNRLLVVSINGSPVPTKEQMEELRRELPEVRRAAHEAYERG